MMIRQLLLLVTGMTLACVSVAQSANAGDQSGASADDFLIVHCLLPGQLRQLGRNSSYVSARRPARLSATDCAARGGEFVRADRVSAATTLPLWLPLAKDGDVNAQLMVGELLEQNSEPDLAAAERWYERAAEKGSSAAMLHLSRFAEGGLTSPANRSTARYWMQRALAVDQMPIAQPQQTPKDMEAAPQNAAAPKIAWQPQQTEALALSERAVARLTEQLHEARTKLEHQEQQTTQQSTQTRTDKETIIRLERQLEHANQTLKALQDSIAERALTGPTISLIDPGKVRSRAQDAMPIELPAGGLELIGRIDAPAGLLSARLDQQPLSVNPAGVFQTRIQPGAQRRSTTLTAIDQQGKRDTLTLTLLPAQTAPPTAGARPAPSDPYSVPPQDPLRSIDYGRFHALVIGNNRYPHLPNLETAVNDAEAMANLLRARFGYQVTTLIDADRYTILSTLNQLRETLTSEDNLLIYYAGHGELDSVNQRGHWLPVDAEPDNSANWISNTAVSDLVNAINARHIFMVVDSCYAGTLTRNAVANLKSGMTPAEQLQWTRQRVAKRARLVLTSGGVAPVLDEGNNGHSVFAGALLDALGQTTEITASRDLYQAVAARVTHAAADFAFDQLPEYAPLRFAGHEAGEFFLVPQPAQQPGLAP